MWQTSSTLSGLHRMFSTSTNTSPTRERKPVTRRGIWSIEVLLLRVRSPVCWVVGVGPALRWKTSTSVCVQQSHPNSMEYSLFHTLTLFSDSQTTLEDGSLQDCGRGCIQPPMRNGHACPYRTGRAEGATGKGLRRSHQRISCLSLYVLGR